MFTILFIKNKRLLLSLPTIFFSPNVLKLYRVLAELLPLAEKSLLTTDPRKSLVTRCCGQRPEGQTGEKPGLTLERYGPPGRRGRKRCFRKDRLRFKSLFCQSLETETDEGLDPACKCWDRPCPTPEPAVQTAGREMTRTGCEAGLPPHTEAACRLPLLWGCRPGLSLQVTSPL